jgi:hypothetical protein
MTITYKEITNESGETYLEMKDADGIIRFVPMVAGNSDYEVYLNKDNPDYGNKL